MDRQPTLVDVDTESKRYRLGLDVNRDVQRSLAARDRRVVTEWPDEAWFWMNNNLPQVTLIEEALFRGYLQGGLGQRFKNLPYGENLALLLATLLFGLEHLGAGW